jgi:hypothetical protein
MTGTYCQICRGNLREGETLSQHFALNQIYLTFFICEQCERCYSALHRMRRDDPIAAGLMAVTKAAMHSQIGMMRELQKARPDCQLKEEIDRKGQQLYELPYLTTEFSKNRDYDCYWLNNLRLLEGFADKGGAIQYVDELANSVRQSLHAEEDAVWREEQSWSERVADSPSESGPIRCVYVRGFEFYSHRLWETKHITFEVLHLQDPDRLEEGLCTYYSDEFLKDPTSPWA